MFMIFEPNINVDEELSALLADFDALAGAEAAGGMTVDSDVTAPPVDPTPFLNPMIGDDGEVFGDPAAPALIDDALPAALVDVASPVTTLDNSAPVDMATGFDLDALLQDADLAFDLDALILSVGRSLESFNFDLFQ